MTETFDALVIGGGPSGATAAMLLAQAGWSVVLLERSAFPRGKVCGEYLSATNWPLLERLGIGSAFRERAGPQVRRVGLFAGTTVVTAALPRPKGQADAWGRGLSRECLDSLLLERAAAAGATVWQPCSAIRLVEIDQDYCCEVRWEGRPGHSQVRAGVVIAAHGSWHPGALPTQPPRRPPRPADLFGFKAHFLQSELPADLMPLLIFPGGYGGMAHCDGGRVSLSCCVRRDCLARLRAASKKEAGEAVLEHILDSCLGVRRALAGARRDGPWRGSGPIRPGLRPTARGGLFAVGNAAGEAHPAIAEGISMAIQSSFLLAGQLIAWGRRGPRASLALLGRRYSSAWRRAFATRIRMSAAVAHWGMRPSVHGPTLPLVRCFPALLSLGARLAGKATVVA
jgi:flavin-dependent dehydrogenase